MRDFSLSQFYDTRLVFSPMVDGFLSAIPIEVHCLFIGWCSWNCCRLDIVLLLCEIFDFDTKLQTDEIQLLIYAQISKQRCDRFYLTVNDSHNNVNYSELQISCDQQ